MNKSFTATAWIFLFLTFFAGISFSAATEEPLKLEITLEDPQDPSQSIAIINGESVKEKNRIGSDEIIRISSSNVTVKNVESGEERVLTAEPAVEPVKPESSAKTASVENLSKTPENPPSENALRKIVNAPGKLMNRFWELRALRDLAIINNAAVGYYNDKKVFPKSFPDLISANFLPTVYASGVKEKYRFYFIVPPDPKDFGVHADPQDADAGLRHFFVGTDTVIREELSGPAGPKSQPHAY